MGFTKEDWDYDAMQNLLAQKYGINRLLEKIAQIRKDLNLTYRESLQFLFDLE